MTLRRSLLPAALLTATLLSACSGGRPGGPGGAQAEEEEERPSPVLAMPLKTGPIEARISSASTIEAELSVTVHAEATGRILKLEVEEGDEVEKGDMLAKVKKDTQATGLERATVNYEKARADLARVQRLFDKGIASQEELDNAKNTARTAKIDRKDRRRDISDTSVKAPFGGTVTERLISQGSFVTNGQQLFSITDFDTLVARVYVPEKELDQIKVGQSAEVEGKAAKGRHGTGTVKRIAPIVDATTGTVKVTVSLPPELAGGTTGFLPGMYAEVTLTTDRHEDALLIAKPALVQEEDRTFAFVVDGDRARKRVIEVGLTNEYFSEVLSGLEPGDQVIVAGQTGLKDGALIELLDLDDPAAKGVAPILEEAGIELPPSMEDSSADASKKDGAVAKAEKAG